MPFSVLPITLVVQQKPLTKANYGDYQSVKNSQHYKINNIITIWSTV